jgi:2',3'-cyclic-nucleotide 2'-phosphodiesterase
VRILAVGDVFGGPGRRAVEARLPSLREELGVHFCVVNGENAADGAGLTPRLAERLLAGGADVITLGNHVWRRAEIVPYLESNDRIVRPGNLSARAPGRPLTVAEATDGTRVAVVNLLGGLFFGESPHGPFEVVDELVERARAESPVVVVDFHAEATSEKIALARWLDGRVTVVVGTHTHVQTNDARVLPGGTAAITDVGMTGPHDSVIGVEAELAIRRLRTGMPVRFQPASGDVRIEALLVDCETGGRATACEALRVPVEV